MLHIAVSEYPQFVISRVDIDRAPPHYAVDTVRLLAQQYPKTELVYLVGGDSLHDLPGWHTPSELVQSASYLGVMHRPDDQIDLPAIERAIPGLSRKLMNIEAPLVEISSSEIRSRIAAGRPFRHYLTVGVYFFICERQLYGYKKCAPEHQSGAE
jgi:nicotinate-nucleotide adenylyltransferase